MTIPKSVYWKGAAAGGAYLLGGKVGKLASLALAGWAAWDVMKASGAPVQVAAASTSLPITPNAAPGMINGGDGGGTYLPATWDAANLG